MIFLRPSYRIDPHQVILLFDEVLAARATTQDWLVFTAVPIRYDLNLEQVRLRSLALEQEHFLGDASRFLFDSTGLKAIAEMRAEVLELKKHHPCEPPD